MNTPLNIESKLLSYFFKNKCKRFFLEVINTCEGVDNLYKYVLELRGDTIGILTSHKLYSFIKKYGKHLLSKSKKNKSYTYYKHAGLFGQVPIYFSTEKILGENEMVIISNTGLTLLSLTLKN